MEQATIGLIILLTVFFVTLLLHFETPVCMLLSSVAVMLYMDIPLKVFIIKGMTQVSNSGLLAIPLFICAGQIMGQTQISGQIVDFAEALIGWARGGLAMANVVASIFFGGMSGSPLADVYSMGTVLVPRMEERGYDRKFSTAVTAVSSLEGLLIPPSHNILMYCMAALTVVNNLNISAALVSGIVPGLFLGMLMCIYCYIMARKNNYPKGEAFNIRKFVQTFGQTIWGLMTIVIIILGSMTGICTATEAASICIVWSLFVTKFIYKDLTFAKFWKMIGDSLKQVSRMGFMFACSGTFGYIITYLRVPMKISNFVAAINAPTAVVIILINLVLLLLGMFMGMGPLIIITTPIFLPVCVNLGMHPITFGIMLIINLAIGMLTPPVGGVLYASHVISGIKIEKMVVALLPWFVILLTVLLCVCFVPSITLWLPGIMGA